MAFRRANEAVEGKSRRKQTKWWRANKKENKPWTQDKATKNITKQNNTSKKRQTNKATGTKAANETTSSSYGFLPGGRPVGGTSRQRPRPTHTEGTRQCVAWREVGRRGKSFRVKPQEGRILQGSNIVLFQTRKIHVLVSFLLNSQCFFIFSFVFFLKINLPVFFAPAKPDVKKKKSSLRPPGCRLAAPPKRAAEVFGQGLPRSQWDRWSQSAWMIGWSGWGCPECCFVFCFFCFSLFCVFFLFVCSFFFWVFFLGGCCFLFLFVLFLNVCFIFSVFGMFGLFCLCYCLLLCCLFLCYFVICCCGCSVFPLGWGSGRVLLVKGVGRLVWFW